MAESREGAALAAGWRPDPRLTRGAIAFQWTKPQLSLRVWAQLDGMHARAYVEWVGDDGRLVHHTIGQAVWQPPEVTERLVVNWGYRCLGKWLGDQVDPE